MNEHDVADRRNGRRIACPLLALSSGRGPLNAWYTDAGGPVAIWRAWAHDVRGGSVDAGHFFPEELPDDVADALTRFFASKRSASDVEGDVDIATHRWILSNGHRCADERLLGDTFGF